MSGNDKKPAKPGPKSPGDKGGKRADTGADTGADLYEDGDMATPKRDFDEDDIKEEEDKRM